MSRLDDELKFALRREQPSPDFADRVLERITRGEIQRPTVWQKVLAFFPAQPFRLVTATAAAALLIAFGLWLYPQFEKKSVDSGGLQAQENSAHESVPAPKSAEPTGTEKPREEVVPLPRRQHRSPRIVQSQVQAVRHRKEKIEKTEGEIAKERLMLALQIASAKLNEAQKLVQNED
jgi:hypothetical protein